MNLPCSCIVASSIPRRVSSWFDGKKGALVAVIRRVPLLLLLRGHLRSSHYKAERSLTSPGHFHPPLHNHHQGIGADRSPLVTSRKFGDFNLPEKNGDFNVVIGNSCRADHQQAGLLKD